MSDRVPGPQPDGSFFDPYEAMGDDEFFAHTDALFARVAPGQLVVEAYDPAHSAYLKRGRTREGRVLVVGWIPRDGGSYPIHARPDRRGSRGTPRGPKGTDRGIDELLFGSGDGHDQAPGRSGERNEPH